MNNKVETLFKKMLEHPQKDAVVNALIKKLKGSEQNA